MNSYPEGFFSSYHSQKPICGVLAVALAAGVTYDVANAACRDAMKTVTPHRQRFGGKTNTPQRELAMKRLGVKFERTNYVTNKPRLIDVINEFEPGVIYHVVTPKHVQTIKDGILIDQGVMQPVELCKQAKKRVSEVTKIIGRGW